MLSTMLAAAALCQTAETPVPLTAAQIQRIDRYVEAEMSRQRIPGLTLGIYRHGRAVMLKGYEGIVRTGPRLGATPVIYLDRHSSLLG